MAKPKINPVILLAPDEDCYIAYDPALDRMHRLNPMAALLTELCDGSRSVKEIAALAGPLMPDGQAGVIERWIADGLDAGLLVPAGRAKTRKLPAREAAQMALRSALFSFRQLKQTERINAAWRDAKASVRRDPSDWDGWYAIGKIAHCLGRRAEARAAYRKYLAANPEDGEIEQVLIALEGGAPPPRASDQAVRRIYRKFAASYDSRMRRDLEYAAPERMAEAIGAMLGARKGLTILDLGCGSGLSGLAVRKFADKLVGIDLSPEMLALARAHKVYDRLEAAEITAWLAKTDMAFDLILSCDCLIYFGDLGPVLRAAALRLKPGGLIAISVERGGDYPFLLADTGRYTHHPDHLREAAKASGLIPTQMSEHFVRLEYGKPVTGLFAILRPADG